MMMVKKPPKDSLTLLPCFYFVELPIVLSSILSVCVLEWVGVLRPAGGGFVCGDPSLSKPFIQGGEELIPLLMLQSLAFSGPAASIMLVEGFIYCLQSRLKLRRSEGSINAGGCSFNSFLRRTVRFVGVHVFGLCSTALLTDIIQVFSGFPAPFFLTVCQPNVSCDAHAVLTAAACSGRDQHAITAARKTFPSQHATLSAFAAVYVSMYFNSTISDSTKLLKPSLVFLFSMAAALAGLTQITQHRSHPADVYAGFLIGAFVAVYLAFHAVSNFKSCDDLPVAPPPAPPQEDALRALTERGHDSVYNKSPASASSHDDITAPPLQRLEACDGGLKRSSVEVMEARSPMGKETMLTFSHTLPRTAAGLAATNATNGGLGTTNATNGGLGTTNATNGGLGATNGGLGATNGGLGATNGGLGTTNGGLGATNGGLGATNGGLGATNATNGGLGATNATNGGLGTTNATNGGLGTTNATNGGLGATNAATAGLGAAVVRRLKAVQVPVDPLRSQQLVTEWKQKMEMRGSPVSMATDAVHPGRATPPRPPEAGPPPVSPKSAVTRAKWLAIREKTSNQPRLLQVVAMTKQRGLPPPGCSSPPPGCSSPPPGSPQEVTVDAYATPHPAVQAPPPHMVAPPPAGSAWEWGGANGGDPRDAYDLHSSFRPHRSASPRPAADPEVAPPPRQVAPPPRQVDREALRRQAALVLLDREARAHSEQEVFYRSLRD